MTATSGRNYSERFRMGGDLSHMIIDTTTSMNAQRIQATQSVAVLYKALEAERSIALSLIQSVTPSPAGTSGQINIVAGE